MFITAIAAVAVDPGAVLAFHGAGRSESIFTAVLVAAGLALVVVAVRVGSRFHAPASAARYASWRK